MINLVLFFSYTMAAVATGLLVRWGSDIHANWLLAALVFLIGAFAHEVYNRKAEERRMMKRVLILKKAYDVSKQQVVETDEKIAQLEAHFTERLEETIHAQAEAMERAAQQAGARPTPVTRVSDGDTPIAEDIADVEAEVRVLHSLLEKLYSDGADSLSRVVQGVPETKAESGAPRRDAGPGLELVPETGSARILDIVRDGLRQDRVDLYVQPVVSLPQRKRRFYECYSRIRDAEGAVLTPDEYLPVAKEAGLVSAIDNMLLFRCLQLLRQLQRQENTAIFFCNISPNTLADRDFLHDFVSYMASHAELAPNLILEMDQSDIEENLSVIEPALKELGGMGYRFSMDGVTELTLDTDLLQSRFIHYVKVDAALVLDEQDPSGGANLRLLKQQLDQAGIDLIVEGIESERMLVELLDFNIDYGQGFLFGEPRISKDPTAQKPVS